MHVVASSYSQFDQPYADTYGLIGVMQCYRRGVDIYAFNPCDLYNRPHVYSSVWLLGSRTPVTTAWTPFVGSALAIAFCVSLFLLPPARTRLGALILTAGVVSNAVIFACYQGNNDLVVFVMAAVAGRCLLGGLGARGAGYALLLAAGSLKFYPVVLIVLALSWVIGNRIARPLKQATAVAEGIAGGKLDSHIGPQPHDETGRLLEAMSRMQQQLHAVISGQREMARRHDGGELSYRIDASSFPGEYGLMVQETNVLVGSHVQTLHDVLNVVQQYAVGDLSSDIARYPGEKAAMTTTVDTVKANLGRINAEIKQLASAAAAGDFSQRGDAQRFDHDFRTMLENLNAMMAVSDDNLGKLSQLLSSIADGDLTARMHGDYQGVFARMRDDANATVSQLTQIVGQIQASASSITLSAGEIASGNSDLSRRTEQQAANLEETAASMEELTSTVRQNAEHARQANQLAIGAHGVASQGGSVVGQVVTTMSAIQASSKKIAEIISVIDGIAFQTNILALNAAVEAARAGEQGRGFAVVASEVRTLAQRSAAAAKEIKGLIDDSVGKVAEGSSLVHQAGSTMGEIVASVQRVTDIMAEISAASQEQSAGIEQVNQTVVQMDETTQQNAALVEEATAAARAMEEQAGHLSEAVSIFVVDEAEAVVATRAPAPRASAPAAPAPAAAAPPARRSTGGRSMATELADGDWQEF